MPNTRTKFSFESFLYAKFSLPIREASVSRHNGSTIRDCSLVLRKGFLIQAAILVYYWCALSSWNNNCIIYVLYLNWMFFMFFFMFFNWLLKIFSRRLPLHSVIRALSSLREGGCFTETLHYDKSDSIHAIDRKSDKCSIHDKEIK